MYMYVNWIDSMIFVYLFCTLLLNANEIFVIVPLSFRIEPKRSYGILSYEICRICVRNFFKNLLIWEVLRHLIGITSHIMVQVTNIS